MAGINSLGIGSGVLTADVLDQLREADDSVILAPLEEKMELNTQKEEAYKLLNGYMSAFKDSTSSLGNEQMYLGRETSGSDDFISMTAKSGADLTSVNITDIIKAENDVWSSNATASSTTTAISSTGSGTLSVIVDGKTLEIAYNSSTTLDDIKTAINDSTAIEATASNLKIGNDAYAFSLTSDNLNEAITFSDTQQENQLNTVTITGDASTGDTFTWSDGKGNSLAISLVNGEDATETGVTIANAINNDATLSGLYTAVATDTGFTIESDTKGVRFTGSSTMSGSQTAVEAITASGHAKQLDTISLTRPEVAQISTQVFTNLFTDGEIQASTGISDADTISGTFAGVAYSYTVDGAADLGGTNTSDDLMTKVAAQMQTDLASIASSVTWDSGNQEMVVTALTAGTAFTNTTLTMTASGAAGDIGPTDTGSTADTANVSNSIDNAHIAQVSTQSITNLFDDTQVTDGTLVAGNTISGSFDGTAYSYTIQASDVDAGSTNDELMTNIAAQMQTDLAAIAESVTWDSANQEIVATAKTPGNAFNSITPAFSMAYSGGSTINVGPTDTASTADTANAVAVAQISTQKVSNLFSDASITSGIFTAGQTISGSFDGTAYSYTVQATDVDGGSTSDELMANIATEMATDLSAIASSVTWDSGNQEMVITALNAGTAFSSGTPAMSMSYSGSSSVDMGPTNTASTGDTANVAAVAQISTQKVSNLFSDASITSGIFTAGQTISGNFDGTAYSYTVQASDVDGGSTSDELMANIAAEMATDLSAIASGVTWDSGNSEMVITALNAGTAFSSATPAMSMSYSGASNIDMGSTDAGNNQENVAAVAQINTQSFSNLFTDTEIQNSTGISDGDTISGTFAGVAYSYTVDAAADLDGVKTSDELMAKIATEMASDLSAIASSVTWDSGNQEMVVTALTPGTAFTNTTMSMTASGAAGDMGPTDAGNSQENVTAVAQINTQGISSLFSDSQITGGTFVAGQTISGSYDGTAYSYTLQTTDVDGGSTSDQLMTNIAAQMQTDLAAIASSVTWDSGNGEMVITALNAGTPFSSATPAMSMTYSGGAVDMDTTDTGSSADTANVTAVAQVNTQVVSSAFSDSEITGGTFVAGQTISGSYDGTAYSYTLQTTDVDAGSTSDQLMTNIAAQMQTDLSAIASSVTWDSGNGEMVITALNAGTPFSSATPAMSMTYSGGAVDMDTTDTGSSADTANVTAVAQISTQTFNSLFNDTEVTDRTIVAGQTLSGTFDGAAYSYTIQASDVDAGSTNDELMTNIAAQMQTDLAAIASSVTWDSGNQEMVVTALNAGTAFSSATPAMSMTYSGGAVDMDPTDTGTTVDTANFSTQAVASDGDTFTWGDSNGNSLEIALVAGEDAAASGITIANAINNDPTLSALYTATATSDGFTIESNTYGLSFTGATVSSGALESSSTTTTQAETSLLDQLDLTNIQTANGASFKMNGIGITRDTNTIDDLINGATITLKKSHGLTDSSSLNITQNETTIKTEMELFVTNFNALTANLKESTIYDPDSGVAGIFNSETFIKGIKSELTNIITQADSSGNSLYDYGVSLDKDGVMSLDTSTFSAKLAEDSAALELLFRGAASTTTSYKQVNTITLSGNAADGDTYTWSDASNGVLVDLVAGETPEESGARIAAAINADSSLSKLYSAVGTSTGFTVTSFTAGLEFQGTSTSTGVQSSIESITTAANKTANDAVIGIFQALDTKMLTYTGSDQLLANFSSQLSTRQSSMIAEYDKQKEALDVRYETMTKKFAAYDAVINRLNNQFASLKSMIEAEYDNDS